MKQSLCLGLIVTALLGAPGASRADFLLLVATLSGPNEAPPNASPGLGTARVEFDTVTHQMRVQAAFTGLTGVTTAAHIHAATALPGTGTAGVATQIPTFSLFPLGVTNGSFDQTLDMSLSSSYNPAFITANGNSVASAEIALFNALAANRAYFNIHTSTFGAGEIRGFLIPVPEPSALALTALGLAGLGGLGWVRTRRVRPI